MKSGTVRQHALITWLCIAVAILEGFDLQVAGVAAPMLTRELELDSDTLGLFFSASTFGLLFGALAGGRIADRVGRIPVLVASVLAFGTASVLTGLADDPVTLIGARALTGLGLGGALPNLIALMSQSAPAGRERRAVAFLYCGVPIGGAAVSLLGTALPDNWRMLFFVGGLLPIAVAGALWVVGRNFEPSSTERSEGEAVAGISQALFGDDRATPTLLLWISFFTTLVVLYFVLNWLPLLLAGMGLSAQEAMLAQLAFNGGGFLACLLSAPLLDTRRAWLVALVAFAAIPFLLYLMALVSTPIGGMAMAAMLGAAILVTQSFLYAITPTLYPSADGGIGTGAAIAWGRIGSIAGPLFGAALIGTQSATRDVLIGTIPVALAAGGAAILLVLKYDTARAAV